MMKKSVKMAVAASMLATPAMANASVLKNMENPLYMPDAHGVYSKLTNGVMLKVADSSEAHKDKHHDGATEFPIIRIQEELGYGITDRWMAHFSAQYTHDDDISRTGLSGGRLGTTYRMFTPEHNNGWTVDVYGDLHLGGLGEMRGQYNISGDETTAKSTFAKAKMAGMSDEDAAESGLKASLLKASGVIDYDNYSNGMWGYHVGTKFGRVWNDRFTTSAFVEVLRTFGDDNSRIRVVGSNASILPGYSTALVLASAGAPSEITAKFKSTTEINAGLNTFYQWSSKWSTGTWFRYNQHASQGVDKITTNVSSALEPVKNALEEKLSDMQDGFDEYIIGLSVAHQFTDHAQVALYGEYTFDTAEKRSQNGTDVKAEMGVRVNVKF
ncbi:MAG: hypothetical protein MJ187_01645 [Alphaproteobacteria bacterium]|nr:hypothetical protein [Alphaproteobacteria bacterium]